MIDIEPSSVNVLIRTSPRQQHLDFRERAVQGPGQLERGDEEGAHPRHGIGQMARETLFKWAVPLRDDLVARFTPSTTISRFSPARRAGRHRNAHRCRGAEVTATGTRPALKRPQVWAATQYVRPIRHETGGALAATHLAEVRSPLGVPLRAYVKHFPDSTPRAMFNEVFGHVVMSAFGVPQPEVAVMPAPVDMLPSKPWAWAFVSCEPRPTFEGTPKQIYNYTDPDQHSKLVQRLFSCPALPLLIAADQLLKNGDRNIGNLVLTGKASFVAIDHGEILGGGAWQLTDLSFTQHWTPSMLIEALVPIDSLKPELRSAIYASAQLVQEKFFEVQNELKVALDCASSPEAAAAMEMVWWRCLPISDWFRERLGLVA